MGGKSFKRAFVSFVAVGMTTAATAGFAASAGANSSPTPQPAPGGWRQAAALPRVPAHAVDLGPTNGSTPLDLSVLLPSRDPAGLAAFARDVSNPASPNYHHFLARGQFAPRFGPTKATIDSVTNALRRRGLNPGPVSGNGLDIPVTTTAAAAQAAFSVTMRTYKLPNGRRAYTNTSAPSLPGVASNAVQGIVGLDNLNPPRPQGNARRTTASGPASPNITGTGGGPSSCASAQNGGQTAEQLATAYGLNNVYVGGDQGAGATIALFELSNYADSDLTTFTTCYGITPTVTRVPVGGGTSINNGVGEVMLDVDVVVELAPAATLLVYEGGSYMGVWNQIVSDDTAQVVSTSWVGGCELEVNPALVTAENTVLLQAASQGQTVFAATGDAGSEDCLQFDTNGGLSVQDPGSQSEITGVGGTNISADGPAPTESGWTGSTGGISRFFTMPSYQTGPGVINTYTSGTPCSAPASTNCREVPDVSALAGSPGFSVYCTAGGAGGCNNAGWTRFFGTSGAAPLWAAVAGLSVAGCSSGTSLGFINPLLYTIAQASKGAGPGFFNDITTGNNDFSGLQGGKYPATSGYDMVTGLGTPIGVPLVARLCNNPTHNVTITGSHVYGTSTTTFNYNGGTLPSGVTSVMGPLIDCLSSVTSGDTPGLYNGTITNCQGLAFVGTNAPKFTMAYVDGGVTVTKAPTTTTLTHSPPSPLLNQAVTFTATVTPTSGSAAVTGTVSFYIDGSLTAAATVPVSSGQASFTTTFGVGTHHVVAVYSGDTDYLGSTSNTDTVTITCTQTITGNHSSLTVTSGTTCLSNAHISGGISVAKGAVLDLENSTVTGSITANKPAGFRMCGSTTGGVSVSGATGFVLIGDPANNCPANTITAGLTVANNTAGLVVIGNTIAASITAYGNSGTSPLGQPVTISGNHH